MVRTILYGHQGRREQLRTSMAEFRDRGEADSRLAPLTFALVGLFGALAFWVRPEGALIVAAAGIVLVAVQLIRSRRVAWRRFLACGAALVLYDRLNEPSNMPDDQVWHDEWICPHCRDGIWPDWPPSGSEMSA